MLISWTYTLGSIISYESVGGAVLITKNWSMSNSSYDVKGVVRIVLVDIFYYINKIDW